MVKQHCGGKPPKGSNDITGTSESEAPLSGAYPNSSFPVSAAAVLEGISQKEVYQRLIDTYRFRVEDEYVFGGNLRGLYNQQDPRPDFHRFLLKVEKKGILPAEWDMEKRKECEQLAGSRSNDDGLHFAIEKHDVQETYRDLFMPMKLRMLAETVYGKAAGMF